MDKFITGKAPSLDIEAKHRWAEEMLSSISEKYADCNINSGDETVLSCFSLRPTWSRETCVRVERAVSCVLLSSCVATWTAGTSVWLF